MLLTPLFNPKSKIAFSLSVFQSKIQNPTFKIALNPAFQSKIQNPKSNIVLQIALQIVLQIAFQFFNPKFKIQHSKLLLTPLFNPKSKIAFSLSVFQSKIQNSTFKIALNPAFQSKIQNPKSNIAFNFASISIAPPCAAASSRASRDTALNRSPPRPGGPCGWPSAWRSGSRCWPPLPSSAPELPGYRRP